MSELNEGIREQVQDADVMQVHIDDTLTHSGEAADAYAVGQALEEKADKKDLQTNITVNGERADDQGMILVYAEHIPMSDALDAESVGDAIERIDGKTGEDIPVNGTEGAPSIREALEGITGQYADTLPMSEDDDTTAAEKMAEMDRAMVKAIQTTGDKILPDEDGLTRIAEVEYAQQIRSSRNIETQEAFLVRTTSGGGSISDGDATLVAVRGAMRHTGYVAEVLNLYVIPIERPTPASITAELDAAVFIAYVQEAGTYNLTYTNAWSADPALYGVTVSGTPLNGDLISIAWDGENAPVMTVTAPRQADPEISAVMDKAIARAYMQTGGIVDIYYTTEWSEDPALYGITISGTPIAGDRLRINYTKWDRGIITTATPTAVKATGWNLYNSSTGRARCTRYSDTYGYRIGGSYVSVEWADSLGGTRTAIEVTDGLFNVPGDGWLFVNGGSSNTYIYTTWSDWISSVPAFESYSENGVDLSGVMALCFPHGLLALGEIWDEIDFNTQTAISRVQRIAYTDEAYAAAEESGLAFDADRDYIYIERGTPVSYAISVEAGYTVSEHGLEFVEGSELAVLVAAMYGPNLRDKLERDVVTYSAQDMGASDQAQARANIGAAAAAELTSEASARATADGKIRSGLCYVEDGNTIAANANYTAGKFICWKGEIYRIRSTINTTVTASNWSTYLNRQNGIGGALSQINADLAAVGTKIGNVGNTDLQSQVASLSSNLAKGIRDIDQTATSDRGTIRGQLLYDATTCTVCLIFTSTVSASNSPGILGISSFKPKNDSAMSCIDITRGIVSAITGSIPCGISTNGTIFVKEIIEDHVYAITGTFIRDN